MRSRHLRPEVGGALARATDKLRSGPYRWPLRLAVIGGFLVAVSAVMAAIAEPPTFGGRHLTTSEMVDMLRRGTSYEKQWVHDAAAGKFDSLDDKVHNFLVETKAGLIGLGLLLAAGVSALYLRMTVRSATSTSRGVSGRSFIVKKSVAIPLILMLTAGMVGAIGYAVIQRGYAVELATELGRAEREALDNQQAADEALFQLREEERLTFSLAGALDSCRLAILNLGKSSVAWSDSASADDPGVALVKAQEGLEFTSAARAPSDQCADAWKIVN